MGRRKKVVETEVMEGGVAVLDQVENQDDTTELKDLVEKMVDIVDVPPPDCLSKEWTDYVMSQFDPDKELIKDLPTCDGLRRVFQKLIGPIIVCNMRPHRVPTGEDRVATVECYIEYQDKRVGGIVRSISDLFDVSPENTPFPWSTAPVATAATKAEARTLRKGLGLQRILSQEEIHQGFDEVKKSETGSVTVTSMSNADGPLSENVRIAMKTMSSRCNIDITKLLKHLQIEETVDNMKQGTGQILIKVLGEYQRKPDTVPADIKNEVLI